MKLGTEGPTVAGREGRSERWVCLFVGGIVKKDLGGWTGGEEGVVASSEHPTREITHHWLGLDSEVSEHFVRPPSTKEFDRVRVHVGT